MKQQINLSEVMAQAAVKAGLVIVGSGRPGDPKRYVKAAA